MLLKERNLPPTKWALGRITILHTGDDQKVRLVTVRTKGNQLSKQPLVNLCRLSTPGDEQLVPPLVPEDKKLGQQPPETKRNLRTRRALTAYQEHSGAHCNSPRIIMVPLLILMALTQLRDAHTHDNKPSDRCLHQRHGVP